MSNKIYEDFLKMTVKELQEYLTARGITTSGYKKAQLVARAFSANEMSLPILESTEEQKKILKDDYCKTLTQLKLPDPKEIPTEHRIDDITTWPPVSLGTIFEYILDHKEFDTEYVGKYKDQKAYSYFDSGFVGEILTYQTKTIHFLYCNVRASMSIHEEKELWVVVKPKGKVLTAWCSCMAGAGRCCNHVIAVLYKVEYANTHGYCSPVCTSIPCGWNKSTKTVITPKRIKDIVVRKKIRSKMGEQPNDSENSEHLRSIELDKFDPREKLQRTMTNERLSNLLQRLSKSNPCAVLFKLIEGMAIPSLDKENLTAMGIASEITTSQNECDTSEKLSNFLKKLVFQEKEVNLVEKLTREQSDSSAWIEHRKGRLTASKHHTYHTKMNTIISNKKTTHPKTTHLVAELLRRDNKFLYFYMPSQ